LIKCLNDNERTSILKYEKLDMALKLSSKMKANIFNVIYAIYLSSNSYFLIFQKTIGKVYYFNNYD
jgi:hypothetical protein